MTDQRDCIDGCEHLDKNEIRPHKDCPNSSESLSEVIDRLRAENEQLRNRIAVLSNALKDNP